MRSILYYIIFISLSVPMSVNAQSRDWRKITSVRDVCEAYPSQMTKIFEALDLDYPGLERVKKAYADGLITEACSALLEYYRGSQSGSHLRRQLPQSTSARIAHIDTILKNVFVVQNVRGQLPWTQNGHRDWHYKGPNNDREWAWLSNRHSQLNQVHEAYFESGNPVYAKFIDSFLRDFIIANWPYPGVKSNTSVWRGLEVAARAKIWTKIFYQLQQSDHFSPATRLLILSSLPDHAHYNRQFHSQNNWLTMEISALATVASDFPEFKSSTDWLSYAAETMTESMIGQVYPDGTQTELSSHYHTVSLRNFELFQDICDRAGFPLPDFFTGTIEKMYAYTANTVRPDGHGILNNDGDRFENSALILQGAEKYHHPEWEYILTNGQKGIKPSGEPSFFYPWAGQMISRSGYNSDAHWSFFDVGPWGSGHQHNDKLHLSVSAFGRDLLVDAGRFAYTGEVAEKFRTYAKGSQGHNVILIDGHGQAPGPKLTDEPISEDRWSITREYDFTWSSIGDFIDTEGNVEHSRGVYYDRGNYWIVVDRITTDRPRKIEALWHWHPECQVTVNANRAFTQNHRGNLQIVPAGGYDWDIRIIQGQETPEIQGWYSEEYNKFTTNPTTVYSTTIQDSAVFVWLVYPSESIEKDASIEIIQKDNEEISLRIKVNGKEDKLATIPYFTK